MEIAPGNAVTPNVRLVRQVGQGGMGSVWVADHLSLHTQVAVKFVSKELLDADGTTLERFNREASLSAKIKSPHVVQIFDHGLTDDGVPFIVMELLEGETLTQRIERRGPLSVSDARVVITQTAKALAKAHQLGIVHRDIKPDNLFLVEPDFDLFVKVLDFGIAKQTCMPSQSALTSSGTMVGTPEFMSPEQALSAKEVDHRADLWALGVVTYYALCGQVPFTGETLGSLCVAIAAGDFTPVTEHRPSLPSSLTPWFERALAIDRNERFQSARDFAIALADALGPAGSPFVDAFSHAGASGPGLDWASELDDGDLDSEPPTGAPEGSSTAEQRAAEAKTLVSKGSPTFSGASLAAGSQARRVSRVAIGAVLAVGLAVGSVVGVVLVGAEGDSSPSSASTGPGSEPSTPRLASRRRQHRVEAERADAAAAAAAGGHAPSAAPAGAGGGIEQATRADAGAGGGAAASARPVIPPPRPQRPGHAPTPPSSPSAPTAGSAAPSASASPPPELPPDRGF